MTYVFHHLSHAQRKENISKIGELQQQTQKEPPSAAHLSSADKLHLIHALECTSALHGLTGALVPRLV